MWTALLLSVCFSAAFTLFFLKLLLLPRVCRLLNQISQLLLVVLLKLSNSMLLLNTTWHHLWVMPCVEKCTKLELFSVSWSILSPQQPLPLKHY